VYDGNDGGGDGNDDGSPTPPTYNNSAEYIEDTTMYTVMSYFDGGYTGFDSGGNAPRLAEQIARYRPLVAAMASAEALTELRGAVSPPIQYAAPGRQGLAEAL